MPQLPQVAFISDATRIAGSEVWLLETLPHLQSLGLEPSLHLHYSPDLDEFAARFTERQVAIKRYQTWEELLEQTTPANLRVVQAGNPQTYAVLLARLPGPKLVLSHDQMRFFYPLGLEALYRLVFILTKVRAWQKADGVLTVSSWAAEFLRSLGVRQPSGLFNGVDPQRFRPASAEELPQLRRKLGWAGFTVLYPARLSPEKNHWALLRTARLTPNYRYILVGEGELGGILKRLAPPNVEFWGRRSDMPELYRAADAMLQPTLAENQSLATLEAMASSLPIVTSRIPAQLELVHHGQTGFTVEPSARHLAAAVRQLAQDSRLRLQLGQAARHHVEQNHTLAGASLRLAQALKSYL